MTKDIPMFDLHADIGYDLYYMRRMGDEHRFDFHEQRLKKANCLGVNIACWIGHHETWEEMKAMVENACADLTSHGYQPMNKDSNMEEGPWFLLSVEGMEGIHENPEECIDWLYDHGVRIGSLCWNEENDLATGVRGNPEHGLKEMGYRVIAQMKKRGMILDVSHMNIQTFRDAIQLDIPTIATHSNVYNLCDHPRNLQDWQIDALANKDGIIGLNATAYFIANEEENKVVKQFAQHAKYYIDRIGVDKVCLGFDYMDYFDSEEAGVNCYDMPSILEAHKLLEELAKLGYTKKEIEQISYQNILRYLKQHL